MKRMFFTSFFLGVILAAASACAIPPSPSPTVMPTPSPLPPGTLVPTVTAPAAIAAIVDQFIQQYNLDPLTVSYVSSEQVDWPDGCLGVTRAGIMCAMVVTPGYRIEILVNSLMIELHTNLDGSGVVLAPLSDAQAQPLYLDWTDQLTPCTEAQVSDRTMFNGACGKNLGASTPLTEAQATQLLNWIRTYAGFVAETPGGTLAFYGQGTQPADDSVQTEIATWLDSIAGGTPSSSEGSNANLVISWSRSGGIAGFCDQVSVYDSGAVSALSCKSNVTPSPQTSLTKSQLDQLGAWIEQFQPTEIIRKDNAVADGMTVTLHFSGAGSQVMPDEIKTQLLNYMSEVVSTLY